MIDHVPGSVEPQCTREPAAPTSGTDQAVLDAELRAFLDLVFADGGMREIRALDVVRAKYPHQTDHIETGYFNAADTEQVLAVARHFRSAKGGLPDLSMLRSVVGVYFTLNPIKPAAYGKAPGRMVWAKRGQASTDADVESRRLLLIDIDSPRAVKGVPATDAEKAQGCELKTRIVAFLGVWDTGGELRAIPDSE